MENPITNTLFRFVSFRSPQLADPAKIPTKYVLQPEVMKRGPFYVAVADRPVGTSKFSALQKVAEGFSDPLDSEKVVKALSPALYDFSVWISRNKTTYTNNELQDQLDKVSATLTDVQLEKLWNNFFYQMASQKSFYVKEAIMQMLIADHVFKSAERLDHDFIEKNDMLLNASVTLPVELFDDFDLVKGTLPDSGVKPVLPNAFYEKKLATTAEKLRLNNYDTLRNELQNSESKYNNVSQPAYIDALKDYDDEVGPLLKTYYEDLETARKAYCSIHDDSIPYDPEDPCQRPDYVPYPDLPVFSFTPDPEITPAKMKSELSDGAYNALLGVLGYDFKMAIPSEDVLFLRHTTYQSVYSALQLAADKSSRKIGENIEPYRKYLNIHGVSVPIIVAGLLQPFNFKIFASQVDMSSVFTLALGVPDNAWQVTNIRITAVMPDATSSERNIASPKATILEDALQFDGFYIYNFPDQSFGDVPTLEFDITFSNGSHRLIKDIPGLLNYGLTGIAEGDVSVMAIVPDRLPPFAPAGFGYRNVGTADYLRLEQTVQCYLEGEVSHIENIMAREYREKATRLLRRSEMTTTTSSETEEEQLSDTSTTNRFEMQSEVNNVLSQSQDMSGYVNAGMTTKKYFLNSGINYASNTSKQTSTLQAVNNSQEITERIMDRVVTRVKEERVVKILEEYEENNKHGYDNRQGNNHVVGVYRWVDKLYKNQIMNYGSRMMLEFVVPEPAKLHILGMTEALTDDDSPSNLQPPVDPRSYEDSDFRISSYAQLDSLKASYWASYYNAEIEPMPQSVISVGESFNIKYEGTHIDEVEANSGNGKITIPEGYTALKGVGLFGAVSDNSTKGGALLSLTIGNRTKSFSGRFLTKKIYLDTDPAMNAQDSLSSNYQKFADAKYTKEVPVSYTLGNHASGDISVTITCQLNAVGLVAWQQIAFRAIIDAYESALEKYNSQVQPTSTSQVIGTNPGFFRQIENTVLRKNCISYLMDRTPNSMFSYGKNMSNNVNTFEDYEVDLSPQKNLTSYASYIQFMEQAFEWEIMSYNFYPYYWGSRSNWASLYHYDKTDDPIFRAFMQSGMARVIVTVRPGFEKAVNLYLTTGQIWAGGEQPVVGNPMFLGLVDEVRPLKAEKYGKAWLTRIPTTLTILQANSIGLTVEKALPCDCDNIAEFEPGTILPCGSNFEFTDSQLGQSNAQKIRFEFMNMDHLDLNINPYTIDTYDKIGFPRIYECMGQIITIDRDASWNAHDSAIVIFERLAQKLSLINGVQAEQADSPAHEMSPDGIRFTVDTSINPDFVFIKKNPEGDWVPEFDMLRVVTSNGNVTVYYSDDYAPERIADKIGAPIQSNEVKTLLPLNRFSV